MSKLSRAGLSLGVCAFLFALAACGDDEKKPKESTGEQGQPVQIVTFVAEPASGVQGGRTTLRWETTNADKVRVLRGSVELLSSADMAASGTLSVELPATANQFTLEASNSADTKTQMITVSATPAVSSTEVKIVRFTLAPLTWAGAMRSISLEWRTENATEVTLTANGAPVPGFPGGATGAFQYTISETTEFKLSATGGGKTVTQVQTSQRTGGEIEPNDTPATAQVLQLVNLVGGESGEIAQAGDLDFYAIDVPEGGSIIAQTRDESDQCTIDTILTLIGTDGVTSLAENDDISTAAQLYCSEISAEIEVHARELPAGRYYLQVRGYEGQQGGATGRYKLAVEIRLPACGNSVPNASLNEQCDDGNTVAGDGCSDACALEIAGTFTGPSTSTQSFSGALGTNASQYVQVTLTSTAWIRARTYVPTAPDCAAQNSDTVLYLLDHNYETIGFNNDIENGVSCSAIDPALDTSLRILPPGVYYLRVRAFPDTAVPAYQLVLAAFEPGCANGVVDPGEVCDDGNTAAGDGCDAACHYEPVARITPPGLSTTLEIRSETDARAYEIDVTRPGQTITATLAETCAPFPTLILYDGSWNQLGRIAPQQLAPGQILCAQLSPAVTPFSTDLAVGTYYLVASNEAHQPAESVGLSVGIHDAACGDGILGTRVGETCDDQNAAAGDGCSAMCTFETRPDLTVEVEPNNALDSAASSSVAVGRIQTFGGSIESGDLDMYRVEIPQGTTATIVARTYGTLGLPESCNGDTRLTLLNADGSIVAENDDVSSESVCSDLSRDPASRGLTAGTYFVRVSGFNAAVRVPAYYLDLGLQ